MLLNFEYISPDIYSKFSKAFWRYLFLEKGNINKNERYRYNIWQYP